MTWYTLYTRTLTGDAGPGNGWTIRQFVPVSAYDVGAPTTGTQIRITLTAAGTGTFNWNNLYAGHGASSGDTVDFDGTQIALLTGGSSSGSLSASSAVVCDPGTYNFNRTKPLVISSLINFPGHIATVADSAITLSYMGGDVAANTDVTPAGTLALACYAKVEVFRADPAGNATVTINKSVGQADPTSGVSISFDVVFNKGVTGFTSSDVDLSLSTAGGSLVANITAGLSGGLGYTVVVTGMLTAGDVTARILAGVCTDVANGLPNNASTSTDNIVAWDSNIIDPNGVNVFEVCTVARNMLRIEVRDPRVRTGITQVLTTPDSGPGTFQITGAANNGYNQIRLTSATYASALGSAGGYHISAMANNGAGKIRCTMYDTTLIGSSVQILHARSCTEANDSWYISVINGTTFDLIGSRTRGVAVTISNASPAVIGLTAHGYAAGEPVAFSVSDGGALPTGLTAGTTYFVVAAGLTSSSFSVSATVGGVAINTSSAGSGTFSTGIVSSFIHAYTGGGVIVFGDQRRVTIHSVGGCVEANGAWVVSRSGVTTVDLTDTTFVNGYTSGGTAIQHGPIVDGGLPRPNPSLGNADDLCHIVGRYGTTLRFQDHDPPAFFNRVASAVAGNYSLTGGLTVTNVYRKSKPYYGGYRNTPGSVMPTASFRHYLYLKLSSNLVSGTTYTLQFPSGCALPPKTFAFSDRVTRCAAIHVDQNGHRPFDPGKLGYLSEWVPEFGVHGEVDFSAVTNWHLIDSGGSIVWSAGAAPEFRIGPTDHEGVSFDAPRHVKSTTKLVRDMGAPVKVTNITNANPGHVTVADASGLANGMVITFSGLRHYLAGGAGPDGMFQAEDDSTQTSSGSPYNYDITNLSGTSFDLGCAKSVFSATVAAGGTGHAIGNVISLNNRVMLKVATVGGGGAITSVTPVPNESVADPGIGAPYLSQASGFLGYPYTLPTNPQAQVTTTGGGTGATFNLTWADNPYDRNMLSGEGPYGNPNTTAFHPFSHSTSGDAGNLLYKLNTSGNKTSTNVYGLNYSAASLAPGTYYAYIPNIGVSDPIKIRESAWYDAAQCYLKGLYNERNGCVLDGRFGFTRDNPGFKSRPGFRVYKSYLPYVLSNYSNPGGDIGDVSQTIGVGGGYDPWITTAETLAFGGHVDAGDWDVRIIETAWFYWQILDTWMHLPAPAQASLTAMGTPTLLSCGLDPVIFAGTDGLPSPIAEVVFGIEQFRIAQGEYGTGATIGGMNYGEGVPDAETTGITTESIYTWYPDPVATLSYAFPAAKLARVLGDLGYASLANVYRTSAIAAYSWSVSIQTDTAARDAWFLPVKTRAGWGTSQYNAQMTLMLNQVPPKRAAVASALFALTGTASYDSDAQSYYGPSGPNTTGEVYNALGSWEYSTAPGANAALRTGIRGNLVTTCADSLNNYAQAPDVSYAAAAGAGNWSMGFGAFNNFQFTHHLVAGYLIHSDATDVTNYNTTTATTCLNSMQRWFGHRHGANQIGLCMTNGIGVRNNLETLHSDSKNSSQSLPLGLCSEGWANDLPGTFNVGFSFIKQVQHPHADPEMIAVNPSAAFAELYPTFQLAWPRLEYFLELGGAIEHAEFTTQQQITPAFAAALFLHGYDGNANTGSTLATATVTIISSLNPSNVGNSVTFTCTVSGLSGTPTGTVVFKDNGVTFDTVALNGAGVAVTITSGLLAGGHAISAVYSGDGVYNSNSNSLTETVNGPPPPPPPAARHYVSFNI